MSATRWRMRHFSILVAILGMLPSPGIASHRAPDAEFQASASLEHYARGEFNVALATLLENRSLADVVRSFREAATSWLMNQQNPERERRLTVIAALTLELVKKGVESTPSDYNTVRPLIEWTCKLLSQEQPSESERLFNLAVVGLLQAARDDLTLINHGVNLSASHLHHASTRFPAESRFRLAWATAPHAAQVISSRPVAPGFLLNEGSLEADPSHADANLDKVGASLASLGADRSVGSEARLRRGVLLMERDRHQAAVSDLQVAAASDDLYVRYVALLMLGVAAEREGQIGSAIDRYREAYSVSPASSAAIAWANALARQGRGASASEVIDGWAAVGPRRDPWRDYSYRDYRLFPQYLTQLRSLIRS